MPRIQGDAQFEAEQDLRTMIESKKIDKSPKRKKAAMAEARKQKAALATINKT